MLLFVAGAAASDPRSAAVRTLSYPNGPTVLLAPDSLASAASLSVWFEAGSRNDPPGAGGLAYALERGALALPEPKRQALEAQGAVFGAAVTPDLTQQSIVLPPELVAHALDVEASHLASLQVSDASLASAIEAARDERERRRQSSPLLLAIERLYAEVFAGHGYARPVSGSDADLGRLTASAARRDLAERFSPSHALIALVGRFDSDEALAALGGRFGAARSASPPPAGEGAKSDFGAIAAPRLGAIEARVPVPVLLVAWRGPGDAAPDAPAVEVLGELLTGGRHTWLERELLGDGTGSLVQTQGSLERRRDASVLLVAAAAGTPRDTAGVELRLVSAVERWAHEPPSEADLERARRRVEASMLSSAQTAQGRAESLASAQLVQGGWKDWERRIDRLRALGPKDVQRAAAAWLGASHRTSVWAVPPSRSGSRGKP